MHYPLSRFSSIPCDALQKLSGIQITNTDELLTQAALPVWREKLASQLEIHVEDLTNWTGMADLVRIKGIGPNFAEIIVLSGEACSVQDYIQKLERKPPADRLTAVKVLQNEIRIFGRNGLEFTRRVFWRESTPHPANLPISPQPVVNSAVLQSRIEFARKAHQRMSQYVRASGEGGTPPSTAILMETFEEACELRPRMVLCEPYSQLEFREKVFHRNREEARFLLKWRLIAILFVVTTTLILYGITFLEQQAFFKSYFSQLQSPLHYFDYNLKILAARASNSQMLTVIGLVAIVLTVLFGLHHLISHIINTRLVIWLFQNLEFQSFYHRWQKQSIDQQKKSARVTGVFLGIFVIVSLIKILIDWDYEIPTLLIANSTLVSIVGGLIALIAAYPSLHFYLSEYELEGSGNKPGLRRMLILNLLQFLMLPLMVFITIFGALPLGNQALHYMEREFIHPAFVRDSRVICANLIQAAVTQGLATPEASPFSSYEKWTENCLKITENQYQAEILTIDANVMAQFQQAVSWFINTFIVWAAITAVAILFVVPYLAIGGWFRGLFYLVLLFTTSQIEEILKTFSAKWLGLDPGQIGTTLVILFLIFASALVFDWLYDTLTDKKKTCPGCSTQIEAEDRFCPDCGLIQV